MTPVCLDSWAVMSWLDDDEPASSRVDAVIALRPVISWINLVEVYYRLERDHGRERADKTLRDLRAALRPDLPTMARMVEVAGLKAATTIALGDCFALATAVAHGLAPWTGDPENASLVDPPCEVVDLRR